LLCARSSVETTSPFARQSERLKLATRLVGPTKTVAQRSAASSS
jgi:hypothetical protein